MPLFEEFLRSETEHADAAWARLLTMKVGCDALRVLRKWVADLFRTGFRTETRCGCSDVRHEPHSSTTILMRRYTR